MGKQKNPANAVWPCFENMLPLGRPHDQDESSALDIRRQHGLRNVIGYIYTQFRSSLKRFMWRLLPWQGEQATAKNINAHFHMSLFQALLHVNMSKWTAAKVAGADHHNGRRKKQC